ncbi:collagen alpha-1(XIV) chain-like [Saccoglossus kowalevskii]
MDKIHQIVLGLLLYNIIGATAQSPTTLQITDFTATSITVIWDPIVADNYEIVFYESKSGEMHVIDNIDQGATTYFISNLNPGTMYQSMTIHAMYAGVPGPQSNVVDQLTLAPAPYVQVEDVGETTITISWNALPVAEKFFINYEEYNTGISHSLTVPGTASTYELIGLKPSTLYVVFPYKQIS